ncbi:hypothetical protein CDD82_1011 [Ophiocordyceps australis]|uniref:Carbohydrate kinase PfkB domain-containing protein n=1 Tax=Ophiocordyceps australis TaxID=1399860 RepID=A0A2C5XD11_9HYPO|nr:hypothetical protein CDD82_1011 [Ophiocordyceps australis]
MEPNKQTEDTLDFVTMGMFIIDDIEFGPRKQPALNVPGGAGTYAALGARLFSPPPLCRSVGYIVDVGCDCPPSLVTLIDSWAMTAIVRRDEGRLTTRGHNTYQGPDQVRSFNYATPKKRITAQDLPPSLLRSRSFHLICSPARCQDLVADITSRRKAFACSRPIFVWEPVPDLCTPDHLIACINTLALVDVCSPNHTELAGLLGQDGVQAETGHVCTATVESACEHLLSSMPLRSYALVIRAADKGCYIASNGGAGLWLRRCKPQPRRGSHNNTNLEPLFSAPRDHEGFATLHDDQDDQDDVGGAISYWLPAYHEDSANVVDPTGGGNAFLGGLAVALARGLNLQDAACWGIIAASFAIEQIGMPLLATDRNGNEMCNGKNVLERLHDYKSRNNI